MTVGIACAPPLVLPEQEIAARWCTSPGPGPERRRGVEAEPGIGRKEGVEHPVGRHRASHDGEEGGEAPLARDRRVEQLVEGRGPADEQRRDEEH